MNESKRDVMMRNTNTKFPYDATNASATTETLLLPVLLLTAHIDLFLLQMYYFVRALLNGNDVSIGTAKCTVLYRFERVSRCCLESSSAPLLWSSLLFLLLFLSICAFPTDLSVQQIYNCKRHIDDKYL